jgi:hypothetical protein
MRFFVLPAHLSLYLDGQDDGTIFYKQILDGQAIIGMALIISGVVVIHLFSKTISP